MKTYGVEVKTLAEQVELPESHRQLWRLIGSWRGAGVLTGRIQTKIHELQRSRPSYRQLAALLHP